MTEILAFDNIQGMEFTEQEDGWKTVREISQKQIKNKSAIAVKYSATNRKLCYRIVKLHLIEVLPALQRYEEERCFDSSVLWLLNDLLSRKH